MAATFGIMGWLRHIWNTIIGIFCKRALQKRRYSAKETYNLKEPTNRSHPIFGSLFTHMNEVEYRLSYRALLQKRPIISSLP